MAASAVSRVLSFPSLASAEEELNGQLVEDAKAAARRVNFAMAHFHHVERQTGQCSVDLYALLPSPTAIYKEGATGNSTRLWPWRLNRLTRPTQDRERKYVTGGNKESTGIQRSKAWFALSKGRHAGIIGYVQ